MVMPSTWLGYPGAKEGVEDVLRDGRKEAGQDLTGPWRVHSLIRGLANGRTAVVWEEHRPHRRCEIAKVFTSVASWVSLITCWKGSSLWKNSHVHIILYSCLGIHRINKTQPKKSVRPDKNPELEGLRTKAWEVKWGFVKRLWIRCVI